MPLKCFIRRIMHIYERLKLSKKWKKISETMFLETYGTVFFAWHFLDPKWRIIEPSPLFSIYGFCFLFCAFWSCVSSNNVAAHVIACRHSGAVRQVGVFIWRINTAAYVSPPAMLCSAAVTPIAMCVRTPIRKVGEPVIVALLLCRHSALARGASIRFSLLLRERAKNGEVAVGRWLAPSSALLIGDSTHAQAVVERPIQTENGIRNFLLSSPRVLLFPAPFWLSRRLS